jgi:cytochrome c biogenesis protein
VTRDPGVTLVYFGFIIMIAGCFVTFFMAHQQICVEAVPRGGKMDIWVSGTANKNRPGFERVLARFAARIQDRLAQP